MINRKNLAILANYLETIAPTLSEDEFSMGDFAASKLYGSIGIAVTHECGTACCAIGWAPNIGGEFDPKTNEDWNSYAERVLGVSGYSDSDTHEAFSFMFSDLWELIDNTPFGAVNRIRYYLDKGLPELFDWLDESTFNPVTYWKASLDKEQACQIEIA